MIKFIIMIVVFIIVTSIFIYDIGYHKDNSVYDHANILHDDDGDNQNAYLSIHCIDCVCF